MPQLDLFDETPALPPQAARLAPKLHALADRDIYFGTSSWKYPGWIGSIYSPDHYETRGKFSKAKFESDCLAEYARTFPTVCGDFAFYQFPSPAYWRDLFDAVPSGFRFGLKAPEDITAAVWPKHARYGSKGGQANVHFLDVLAFKTLFAARLKPYMDKLGPIIFEFGTFNKSTFPRPDDFYEALAPFLGSLPKGFQYAVEIRNSEYLTPAYLAMLADHNVAHTFNAWTRMPTLPDQAAIPEAFTADFVVVRALLARGRAYENAVRDLEPYEQIKEPDEVSRAGLVTIARNSLHQKKHAYLFINNRLEGNSPSTIEAVVSMLGEST
jgi:uncharacterized protein YecE (DUF72 family)